MCSLREAPKTGWLILEREGPLVRGVVPYAVLAWAAVRYDRFHFYCDRGILTPRRRSRAASL